MIFLWQYYRLWTSSESSISGWFSQVIIMITLEITPLKALSTWDYSRWHHFHGFGIFKHLAFSTGATTRLLIFPKGLNRFRISGFPSHFPFGISLQLAGAVIKQPHGIPHHWLSPLPELCLNVPISGWITGSRVPLFPYRSFLTWRKLMAFLPIPGFGFVIRAPGGVGIPLWTLTFRSFR